MTIPAADFFGARAKALTPEVEARFFSSIKLSNSTFKKTDVNRFADVNDTWLRVIVARNKQVNSVLDVAVSAGTTTLELIQDFEAAGLTPEVVATDLLIDAYIVSLHAGVRALADANGFVLQYDLMGCPLRPWRRRLDYVTGMVAVRWLANSIYGRMTRAALARPHRVRPVRLISPRLACHPRAQVMADDVMARNSTFAGAFDLIRAANILNRGYFADDELRSALANLRTYLAPGGQLLLIRTSGRGDHEGTILELAADGSLRPLHRFGRGSEIEELAMNIAT